MKRFAALAFTLLPAILFAQQYVWDTLPANTFPDDQHAPFILGVASNEPGQDHVYLWIYAEPDSFSQETVAVNWEVSVDSNFSLPLKTGTTNADSSKSWTSTFKVDGLNPDTYYWYRFNDGKGNQSVVGRTRTLPVNSNNVKLAVTSCSNIIAFYNTYARIAERDDLNAVIHLGDFAYDNLNENRSVRIPTPNVTIRCGLDERRKRDYLHLLDPDLRAIRQMHPMIYLWDNHDIQRGDPESVKDVCRQVFHDFTGQPMIDSADLARQHRKISLGNLVDIFIIDIQYTQDRRDTINGEESYLGQAQLTWLLDELQNSTAKWKLIGNQKLVTPFSVEGLENIIPSGVTPDEKAWDGYASERGTILSLIKDNDIDNVMILSGDAHFVVVADVPADPFDSLAYNGETGEGSICVEFLPSGISSPNIDERGVPYYLGPAIQAIALNLNPHQQYAEFMDNGYGILDINQDSIAASVWLLDAQTMNTDQYLADEQILIDGENHWKRAVEPVGVQPVDVPDLGIMNIYPNPARDELNIEYLSQYDSPATIQVLNVQGKLVISEIQPTRIGTNKGILNLKQLPSGSYILKLFTSQWLETHQFIKQ